MSYRTKPCFVGSFTGWDDKALEHPTLRYLSNFNTDFCETKVSQSGPHTKWFTQDFEFQTQSGQTLRGEEAWKRLIHTTRLYDKFSIEPLSAFIQDTEDGYNGMVYANLYTNFVKPGEKNCSDKRGINWELRVSIVWDVQIRQPSTERDLDPEGLLSYFCKGFQRATRPESQ